MSTPEKSQKVEASMDNVKGMFTASCLPAWLLKRGRTSNNHQMQEKGIALQRPRERERERERGRERERENRGLEGCRGRGTERSRHDGSHILSGRKPQ